jgi:hypothetical protein
MNYKNKLLQLFLLLSGFGLYAQNQTFISDLIDPVSANFSLIYGEDKIKGNPYLFEDWKKGEILTIDGRKIAVDEIKIDVCSQKIVSRMNRKEQWLNNSNIIAVSLDNGLGGMSMYIKTQDKDENIVFAKIIAEGDYSLLSFPSKKFKKPNGQNDYSYGARDVKSPFFTDLDSDYYLTYMNDNHAKVKLKIKDIGKKIQKKHQRLFSSFTKNLDLEVNNETDAANFLKQFNMEINQRESTSNKN